MELPEFAAFYLPTRIIFGKGIARDFSVELGDLRVSGPFIVTDQTIMSLGLVDYVKRGLEANGIRVRGTFDEVPQDSSVKVVGKIGRLFQEVGADSFIAIGGGSVIDSAKGANIIAKFGGDLVKDYSGANVLPGPLFPLVVVPTTAGTGSEVTNAAVIYEEETRTKLEFVDRFITPNLAVLDPHMTKSLPAKITAFTGLDALTHAVEAFIDVDATPFSDIYAKEAISIITSHLIPACVEGENLEERGWMAIGATLAGVAFSHSECGIVHGIAHALGAVHRVPHGIANAIILPYGLEYNLPSRLEKFGELAKVLNVHNQGLSEEENGKLAIEKIRDFEEDVSRVSGLPLKLREVGVLKENFILIAEKTLQDGTSVYNPREETLEGVVDILQRAY